MEACESQQQLLCDGLHQEHACDVATESQASFRCYVGQLPLSYTDGSCAKHLTVESYTAIYAANSHTYSYSFSITHSLFHSRLKTFLFCKSFPPQPFYFFFRTDYMIPQTSFTLFSCRFRAVD